MANIRTKYTIQEEDFYNFNKKGFMIEIIYGNIIIINTNRYDKNKQLQPNNHKWITTIEYINNDGFILPPFLIVQNVNHFAF